MAWARQTPVPLRKCNRLIRFRRSTQRPLVLLLLVHALAACAPSPPGAPPPSRSAPGAYVVVTDREFDAGRFRLEFPPSWTVIKANPADVVPIQVVFAAPDGGIVSLSQVDSVDSSGDRFVTLDNGLVLSVSVAPAAEPAPKFMAQAEQLVASISP